MLTHRFEATVVASTNPLTVTKRSLAVVVFVTEPFLLQKVSIQVEANRMASYGRGISATRAPFTPNKISSSPSTVELLSGDLEWAVF